MDSNFEGYFVLSSSPGTPLLLLGNTFSFTSPVSDCVADVDDVVDVADAVAAPSADVAVCAGSRSEDAESSWFRKWWAASRPWPEAPSPWE